MTERKAGPHSGKRLNQKLKPYVVLQFSMYSGKKKRVTIRFINMILDVAVERFGTKDARYSAVDDKHFTVTAEVEISDLFFGWLLSFGRRVKILYPSDVLEDFRAYRKDAGFVYAGGKAGITFDLL